MWNWAKQKKLPYNAQFGCHCQITKEKKIANKVKTNFPLYALSYSFLLNVIIEMPAIYNCVASLSGRVSDILPHSIWCWHSVRWLSHYIFHCVYHFHSNRRGIYNKCRYFRQHSLIALLCPVKWIFLLACFKNLFVWWPSLNSKRPSKLSEMWIWKRTCNKDGKLKLTQHSFRVLVDLQWLSMLKWTNTSCPNICALKLHNHPVDMDKPNRPIIFVVESIE